LFRWEQGEQNLKGKRLTLSCGFNVAELPSIGNPATFIQTRISVFLLDLRAVL
jgi:hypothetical protein